MNAELVFYRRAFYVMTAIAGFALGRLWSSDLTALLARL